MKKRFLSLLCVLALCLGLLPTTALADFVVVNPGGDGGDVSVDVDPNNPDNVVVIVPGGDGNTTVVVIPDDEPEPAAPVIGDTVEFAGYEWYIIGTETEGVTAPAGCYTLFAKNDDFGDTAFRTEENGGDHLNSTANIYKGSDLHKKMEEIANSSLSGYKDDIVPRDTLDNITGDQISNQYVWSISQNEANSLETSFRKFEEIYWARTGIYTTAHNPAEGGNVDLYTVIAYNTDGSERWEYTGGAQGSLASKPTNVFAVRPALYVKTEAVTLAPDVIGDTVNFAGHEWYIIGTQTKGVKAPSGCYTLFAKNNDFGSTAFRAGADDDTVSTVNHYKNSDLQKRMGEIADGFSAGDKANISARATLDGIAGESPTNQLLWPVSQAEWYSIDQSLRAFPADYWTRAYFEGDIGSFDNPSYVYRGWKVDETGEWGSMGAAYKATPVNETYAVRPALYVKAEALEFDDGEQAAPLIGGTVAFGGRDWYIVGMGDVGAVTGPANTVTLFAPTLLTDSNKQLIQAQTSTNYSEGQLCTVLQGLGDTLGLSERETDLISSRTLTTADEITGDSVTTPFWPLSKSEFEAIKSVNPSLLKDLKADTGSYNGFYYSLRTSDGADKVYSVTEHGVLKSDRPYNDYVRPAFYLDISELFFAAGFMSVAWKGDPPRKIEPPSVDNNVWTFVLYDREHLSLKMGCKKEQTGESLTFKYEGTKGENHWLSYVLEKTSAPGIPVYYGSVASLEESGSGTVTVPLLGYGSHLEDGDYTLRFYTEDQSNMGFYLASDTVNLKIRVADGEVSITDMGDVGSILGISGVTVEPQVVEVEAGKTQQFTATVTGGGEWYDPSVVWSVKPTIVVEGQSLDPGTTITQDGLLTVSTEEKAPFLTVTATSAQDSSKSYSAEVTVIPHTHTGTFQAGSPATCSQNGVKDYYTCTCGKAFEDVDCTKPIEDLDNWKVIPALPHQSTLFPGTPATCTTDGVKDYYQCSVCHQYFEDADCNTPITDLNDWKVIPALPHQGTLVPGTPATCTTDGVKDYYQCSICHQYFEDADCTKSIADLDSWKVILAPGHIWSDTYLAEHADESKHYHVCTVCGARDVGEAHTWNAEAATEEHDKHCIICGYVRQPAPQEYTIAFDANGGSVSQTSAVTAGGRLASLPIPTRGGYDFVGWYTEKTGGDTVTTDTVFTKNSTIYAHWSSSGGGGGSGISPTYIIQASQVEHGTVTVNPSWATWGRVITIIVIPQEGYALTTLVVTDRWGEEIALKDQGDGKYTFIMPASNVTVKAAFEEIVPEPMPFTDLVEGAWYQEAVEYVYRKGIMNGVSATAFKPGATLSRAMVAQILYNLEGQPAAKGESAFTDVRGHWAASPIAWAQERGVLNGYEDNTFRPDRAVSREELAQMLYNYAKYKGYDLTAAGDLTVFPDGDDVSDWAEVAMEWANGMGLINGFEDNTLLPGGTATRAQAAVMLTAFSIGITK